MSFQQTGKIGRPGPGGIKKPEGLIYKVVWDFGSRSALQFLLASNSSALFNYPRFDNHRFIIKPTITITEKSHSWSTGDLYFNPFFTNGGTGGRLGRKDSTERTDCNDNNNILSWAPGIISRQGTYSYIGQEADQPTVITQCNIRNLFSLLIAFPDSTEDEITIEKDYSNIAGNFQPITGLTVQKI